MSPVVLPLTQPTNNTEIQKITGNTPEAKGSNFSDMFDTAVKKQPNIDKTSTVQNSDFELTKTVSAKEFLEKLGLNEDAVQEILQINGLNENATLLELLNSVNLSIDNLEKFLETSATDLLGKLGIEDEKTGEIVQLIAGQGEKPPTIISVKNLFENIGLGSEKYSASEVKDLSLNDFSQKLGLNEKETSNLIKELVAGKPVNDKMFLNLQETNAKDLLKQMGLNPNEITKVLEINFENSDLKNKLKNLILNKDFTTLKQLVSSEKFNINISGKSNFQGVFQTVNKNAVSDTFTGKVQSEMILPTNPVSDSSPVSSVQTSGSMNGTNVGSGTNGYAQLTNEIPTDSRLQESTPKAFFERTVIDQIVSKVSFKVTDGLEEIKIRLEPPSLGSLQLKISVEGKTVNAVIVADNNMAKEIIQSNLQQLKDSMAEQGLKLDNISVSVGDGQSGDRDMDEFRMLLTKENMDQNADMEDENNSNLIEQNSGIFHKTGYMLSQSGVDLFI